MPPAPYWVVEFDLCGLTWQASKTSLTQHYEYEADILAYISSLLSRIIVMYLHILQAHPELPRLPTQGFEAEDNVLSRMI
jgi:hypothetical protein